jgi:hypothetical protein
MSVIRACCYWRFLVLLAFVGWVRAAGVSAAEQAGDPTTVLEWSSAATTTIVTVGLKFPCRAAVYKGIVHAAIYDAVVGIEGGFEPYTVHAAAPEDASADAAAAQAAHDVLVGLFPAQQSQLDAVLAVSLARVPDGQAEDDGVLYGHQVAIDILALRQNDNLEFNPAYSPGSGPGAWVAGPNPVGTGLGHTLPLIMSSGDQFRPDGPPALASAEYANALDQVRSVGAASSATRTSEQTESARFYVEHAVPQFTRALNKLSIDQKLTLLGAARMLAMTAIASGDACIACFDAKYYYSFWRPITAIRNDTTAPDPAWTPLIPTPNHPSYPSAHSCYTEATTESLKDFFGTDHVTFTVDSTSTGTTHTFRKFSDFSKEVVNARVWGGIHFRTDDTAGAAIGRDVARWLGQHYLRPIWEDGSVLP